MVVAKVLFLLYFVGICYCVEPGDVGIVGGHQITIQQVPFMASLRINITSGMTHYCGASIINENRKYQVNVGTDRMNGNDGELYDVEKIIVNKRFSNVTYNFDVALIKLARDLVFDWTVAPIKLADATVKLPKNIMMNVTGWGSTGKNPYSSHLLQAAVPLVRRKQCQSQYKPYHYNITHQMMCAGKKGKDTCQGDSGGPLTIDDVQVGITSFGHGCGEVPGVYVKVSTVLPWITRQMKRNQ